MDQQQELSLGVENNSDIQETMKVEKQILTLGERQVPAVFFGGVGGECHDVTICLVPRGSGEFHKEFLTVLKVHSSRLIRYSKYFETCMSERWTKPSSPFLLETHTDIACYTDCISRIYRPLILKDFGNVEYSLKLLKVASQIQFHELMNSILLYISSKFWSDSDELMIRLYLASPDFPRNHARDLVVRLGVGESREDCHKQLLDVVKQCIRSALGHDANFLTNRAFIDELLTCGLSSDAECNFMEDVVMVVSREAKNMLVGVEKECEGRTYGIFLGIKDKILSICWILEALLAEKVADEVVETFVHLHAIADTTDIFISSPTEHHQWYSAENKRIHRDAVHTAEELAELVLKMFKEVAAGNVLLETQERIALLKNWHLLLRNLITRDKLDGATKELFSTLPLKQQLELVRSRTDSNYQAFIGTDSLAKLLRKEWPTQEVKHTASSPSISSPMEVATV